MILLDPTTVIFMATLMAIALSVVLYSAHASFPKEIQGLREWASGLVLLACGAVLFSLRNHFWVQAVPLLCANSVLIWGLGCTMIGTEKFYGLPQSWRLFSVVWIVCMGCVSYWLVVKPDFSARIASFSFLVLIFYLRQVILISKHGEAHFSTRFFFALMVFQSCVVFARGTAGLMGFGEHINLLSVGPTQTLFLAAGHFMILLMTVGFMTVATRRLQVTLELRSTLDPLTQVLNRRGFSDIYTKEHALMRREGTYMTMLNIDIDYFKKINDNYGHATGDRVLIDIATVIRKAVRVSDHVSRFGGEEFVVLLPSAGLDRAMHIAERIQAALRSARSDLPPYTVSIGVAVQTSAVEDLDSILLRADKAMYCAKERGRDRIEVAPDASGPRQAVRA